MSYHSTGYRGLGQDDLAHDYVDASHDAATTTSVMQVAETAQPEPTKYAVLSPPPAATKPKVASTYVAPKAAPAVTYVPPPPPSTIKPWMWWAGGAVLVVGGLVLLKR